MTCAISMCKFLKEFIGKKSVFIFNLFYELSVYHKPSIGLIVVSKIALHLSELKIEKRTGAPFPADLNYENDKM